LFSNETCSQVNTIERNKEINEDDEKMIHNEIATIVMPS
jgi:hypothetical protein